MTVQLPVFNEMYVVERRIDAVCEQDYPRDRFEIQVLDDSIDETCHVAAGAVARQPAGIWRRTPIEQAGGWQRGTPTENLDVSYRAQSKLPIGVKAEAFVHLTGPVAFGRRCLPAGGVASHPNIPDLLTRRVSTALGATMTSHHGLLAPRPGRAPREAQRSIPVREPLS